MSVDEYAALIQKLAVANDQPCQTRLWRRGRPDLLVDRPGDFMGSDGHAVVGVLDDDATIHTWDVLADWFVTGTR